jgi:hypothetical protein
MMQSVPVVYIQHAAAASMLQHPKKEKKKNASASLCVDDRPSQWKVTMKSTEISMLLV